MGIFFFPQNVWSQTQGFRNKTLLIFLLIYCKSLSLWATLLQFTWVMKCMQPFGTPVWYHEHNTKLHIYVTLLTGILTWSSTSKQDVDIPKQKHGVQPSALLADRAKVPGLHSLHCSPNTFSWRREKKKKHSSTPTLLC